MPLTTKDYRRLSLSRSIGLFPRTCAFLIALALFSFLLTACRCPDCPPCNCPTTACPSPDPETDAPYRWFVVHVTDGDTLKVRMESNNIERTETVRLLNIDTPERKEPGFVEATEALKGLVRGGYVELRFEKPGVEKRDGFGRLLAYVYVGEQNVNVELVRQGWSRFYTKYGKGRLATQFQAAESQAARERRGLHGM